MASRICAGSGQQASLFGNDVDEIAHLVAAKDNDANKAIITSIVRENKSSFLSTDFIF